MANPAPICTHVKTDGVRCGSLAVSGTDFCYHHSAVKLALGKASSRKGQRGEFEPIPFVFPEDRASMQINFFLLLQAFNEGRVDLRNYRAMLSMLKSMAANLGKSGSLVEEDRDQGSGTRDQKGRDEGSGTGDQKGRDQGSGTRDQKSRDQGSGTGDQKNRVQGSGTRDQKGGGQEESEEPFKFSPGMMAKLEEVERLDPNDPSYAERIRAAVAEGLHELKAHGIDVVELPSR